MFKTEESSYVASPSYHQPEEFNKKAQSLLLKFETIQDEIESEKADKFRNMLGDLLTLENQISEEAKAKKDAYSKMFSKITQVTNKIEDEKKKCEKFKILLQGKIDTYRKINERAFEKLRADRIARQNSLDKFIEEKTQWILRKSNSDNS